MNKTKTDRKRWNLMRLFLTVLLGSAGGTIFMYLNTPIPWMLGPLTAVMLVQSLSSFQTFWPVTIKNNGLIVLGVSFGLYFNAESLAAIGPYLLPYVTLAIAIIAVSILQSLIVTKWINIDRLSSVFGAIPGGLTEMVIAGESLGAKPSYVIVFQTIRLLLVLFAVPFFVVHMFSSDAAVTADTLTDEGGAFAALDAAWLLLPVLAAWKFHRLLPAGWIVIPMLVTAVLAVSPAALPSMPEPIFLAAQAAVGISLGKQILLQDIKKAGNYGFVYAGLAVSLIIVSFGFGFLLARWTAMDLPTALLSTAPGGLVEMVLTASMVGADPSVVTSLQLLRILLIILVIPAFLKWLFKRMIQV
ncbi:AbrB family transcriptional regulator [Salisediminibacterium halotolerans]|uniref:AbrB family transcriptional regulator n=2 Tax=Salisediminibacterium halotolerans TaxID=517425 RepID=UPI000EACC364|nr:AbrB family transcriptional regulator [Salisediminibacterium halotolerans]